MIRTHCSKVREEMLSRMGAIMSMIAEWDWELTDKDEPAGPAYYTAEPTEYIVYKIFTAYFYQIGYEI